MVPALDMTAKLLARYPWVSPSLFLANAPMRVFAGPALAVAVSRAGGLGFLGGGPTTNDTNKDLEKASALISEARFAPATSSSSSLLPIGVGYQLWADDLETAAAGVAQHAPCAAWLFGPRDGAKDYDAWSARIRAASPQTQIWIQISSLAEAKALLDAAQRPDVVVVQGAEAGGHAQTSGGLGLVSLLPEVADAFASSQIPLFAAGGIADSRGVDAAICLGASGAVMGTRFLAAKEARVSKGYQDEVVRASDGAASTTRTLLYNHLRGTFGWPEGYVPRTIINKSLREHEQGKSFEELKGLYAEALKSGDAGWGPEGRLATYAGTSIGLISDVKDAESIIRDVEAGHAERMQRFTSSAQSSRDQKQRLESL